MDEIELVSHRYRELADEPPPSPHHPDRRLAVWLADDVGGLVAEYARRPRFREYATWSLRNLTAGGDSPAAAAVATFETAAVHQARLLRAFIASPEGQAAVAAVPAEEVMTCGEFLITADGVTEQPVSAPVERYERGAEAAGWVSAVANRFWDALASPDDYFWPLYDWRGRAAGPGRRQDGSFLVGFNPELHTHGDFVVRCLLHRVGMINGWLTDAHRLLCPVGRPPTGLLPEADHLPAVREAVRAVEGLCREPGEAPLRDACVTLTQVYAAFHPAADLGWLGPTDYALWGVSLIAREFSRCRTGRGAAGVAAAVRTLRHLYAGQPPGRTALEEAVAGGGLVVDVVARAAYWSGQPLSADLAKHQTQWRFLVALARAARRGRAVAAADLYPAPVSDSTMHNLFSRLKKQVPPSLWREVRPGDEPRTYRLQLPADRVHVMDDPTSPTGRSAKLSRGPAAGVSRV